MGGSAGASAEQQQQQQPAQPTAAAGGACSACSAASSNPAEPPKKAGLGVTGGPAAHSELGAQAINGRAGRGRGSGRGGGRGVSRRRQAELAGAENLHSADTTAELEKGSDRRGVVRRLAGLDVGAAYPAYGPANLVWHLANMDEPVLEPPGLGALDQARLGSIVEPLLSGDLGMLALAHLASLGETIEADQR